MNRRARQRLGEFRAPDEARAEQRAWTVVARAYQEREAVAVRRPRRRIVLAPALALVVASVVLSPAGATVGRLITKALVVQHPAPALTSLPASGRLLLSGPGGTWTAAADGSTRHLGSWREASWSPRGLFVAVASRDRLAAVDPRGTIRWAVARPSVSDPRWFSPSGYRVAYLSSATLRVIGGDGTGDHLLATDVAPVAPAWRPGHPYQVAYVTVRGRLVVRDGDTGRLLWALTLRPRPRELMWSGDGERLLVLSAAAARVYAGDGALSATIAFPRGRTATDGALSPDGRMLALVLGGNQVAVARIDRPTPSMRALLAVRGLRELSWSPSGRWLIVASPAADQWVFLRADGAPRVAAVARIAEQFSAGRSPAGFPRLEGWCCTIRGAAG